MVSYKKLKENLKEKKEKFNSKLGKWEGLIDKEDKSYNDDSYDEDNPIDPW